jgi:hypothetical protein
MGCSKFAAVAFVLDAAGQVRAANAEAEEAAQWLTNNKERRLFPALKPLARRRTVSASAHLAVLPSNSVKLDT